MDAEYATAVVETPEAPASTPISPEPSPELAEPKLSELATFRAARAAEAKGEEPAETPSDSTSTTTAAVPALDTAGIPGITTSMHSAMESIIDQRVDRIGAKTREASEQQIHRLQQELYTLRGSQPAAPVAGPTSYSADPNDPEPSIEEFSDESDPYQALTAASARWHTRQENKLHDAARSRAESQVRVEAHIDRAQQAWDGKLEEVRKRLPDFDTAYGVVHEAIKALPNAGQQTPLVETLLTSPIGHDLAHYLGTHPDELSRLFQSPSLKAHLVTLGRLEERVEAELASPAPAHPITGAPPPPMATVGSSATPTHYDPKTATLAQFRRHNNVLGGQPVRRATG